MAEETTSTAAVQYAIHRQVWNALKAAYASETDDVLDTATAEILGAGAATIDAQGKVHFTPAVAKIAPRLAQKEIKGSHEEARLARSQQITAGLAPLHRVKVTDLRAALEKIGPLPPNASDQQKCQRAAALTAAYEAAGLGLEDENGSD